MNLRIIQPDKTREAWLKQACTEYLKRLGSKTKLDITETQTVMEQEANSFLKRLDKDDFLLPLNENAQAKTSLEFAEFLDNLSLIKSVVFLNAAVGGAHESPKKPATINTKEPIDVSDTYFHYVAKL